jgi:hypothetical protein
MGKYALSIDNTDKESLLDPYLSVSTLVSESSVTNNEVVTFQSSLIPLPRNQQSDNKVRPLKHIKDNWWTCS